MSFFFFFRIVGTFDLFNVHFTFVRDVSCTERQGHRRREGGLICYLKGGLD